MAKNCGSAAIEQIVSVWWRRAEDASSVTAERARWDLGVNRSLSGMIRSRLLVKVKVALPLPPGQTATRVRPGLKKNSKQPNHSANWFFGLPSSFLGGAHSLIVNTLVLCALLADTLTSHQGTLVLLNVCSISPQDMIARGWNQPKEWLMI